MVISNDDIIKNARKRLPNISTESKPFVIVLCSAGFKEDKLNPRFVAVKFKLCIDRIAGIKYWRLESIEDKP